MNRFQTRYCVRVLTGPLARAVYVADDRLEIGRASSSDIQLLSGGVSRTHAVVLHRDDGHVLVDLMSTNGTIFDGERIQERKLQPGDVFSVGESKLMFDELEEGEVLFDPGGGPNSGVASRQPTVPTEIQALEPDVPPDPSPAPRPAPARTTGTVVADIMAYRNLRLKKSRGQPLPDSHRARFRHLDDILRVPPHGTPTERRAFLRFPGEIPAGIAFEDSRSARQEVRVVDLSVDGARMTRPDRIGERDALCWLSIPVEGPTGSRTAVFVSRLVWVRPDEIGIVFSGAPRWDAHSGDAELVNTRRFRKLTRE